MQYTVPNITVNTNAGESQTEEDEISGMLGQMVCIVFDIIYLIFASGTGGAARSGNGSQLGILGAFSLSWSTLITNSLPQYSHLTTDTRKGKRCSKKYSAVYGPRYNCKYECGRESNNPLKRYKSLYPLSVSRGNVSHFNSASGFSNGGCRKHNRARSC